jgi:hypothetical protein
MTGAPPFGVRPGRLPGGSAEAWVRRERGPAKGDLYSARLTVDVTPELRARIKLAAFGRGLTMAELLRTLLAERFPAPAEGPGGPS